MEQITFDDLVLSAVKSEQIAPATVSVAVPVKTVDKTKIRLLGKQMNSQLKKFVSRICK